MPGNFIYRKKSRSVKSTSRRYQRKKYNNLKRRYIRNKKTPVLTRFKTGVPDRTIVRMTYEDIYNMVAPGIYQWRMNSIFDPDYTGAGHQPRSHDQWGVFFSSYRVIACKAKFFLNNTDDTGGVIVGLIPDNVAGTYTTGYLSEYPRCKAVCLSSGDGGTSSKTLNYKVSIPHVLGMTSRQYKYSDNTKCAFGTNPANIAYLSLVTQSLGSYTGATATVQIRANFTFIVELLDRVELGQS